MQYAYVVVIHHENFFESYKLADATVYEIRLIDMGLGNTICSLKIYLH